MTFDARTKIEVDGIKQLRKSLDALGKAAEKRIAKTAVRKAAIPIAKKAKGLVKVKTGNLRKSIASYAKMSKRKKGIAIAIVGPRRRFTKILGVITRGPNNGSPRKTTATNISHLVERGHGPANSNKLRYSRKQKKMVKNRQAGKTMRGKGSQAPAYPFMEPALVQSRSTVSEIIRRELAAGIEKEAAKLAAKK